MNLTQASPTPQLDAALLAAHALRLERSRLLGARDEPAGDPQVETLRSLVAQRKRGVPVAYLIESAGFMGREFSVSGDVLVPRPATEHLVEAALAELRSREPGRRRAADIGTGSGAIAVTLAAEVRDARVVASDISEAALAVARRNAQRHGVAGRIDFVCGDLLSPLLPFGRFDAIVANLPYVPSADIPLPPDPVSFEPRGALDGGPDGLQLYRGLLRRVRAVAAPGAVLLLEAAPPTIEQLAELVRLALPAASVAIERDYSGSARFVWSSLS